ncbi:MAG TPA: PilN domain-containing protein [Terriglobales bacterium]|nr:PilN domain-containing protein [Terriglobales bacterium]
MRLDINLATHPYEDSRRFWLQWGGAMAALGLLTIALLYLTFIAWLGARKDRALISQYEQQIAERDKERADAQALMNLPQNANTRDRSQFLNDLFYRKAFSWTRVFENLEDVMPPRVHVVSIHPELTNNNELAIKLVIAGDSRERALELVRKMEASKHFRQTEIQQETAESANSGNQGDTVKLDISAIYVPELQTQTAQESAP